MGFTEFLQTFKPLAELSQILAGLGLVTVLLAVLKRNAERRCWRNFKSRVRDWAESLREADRHHRDLSDAEWKTECERMLSDANFSPMEIAEVLDTSVIVAKGIAADMFFS